MSTKITTLLVRKLAERESVQPQQRTPIYALDQLRLGVVIFHPYAHLGGSCEDAVVLAIFRQGFSIQ